jgi:hypothetical protein
LTEQHVENAISDEGAKFSGGDISGNKVNGNFRNLAAEFYRENTSHPLKAEKLHHIEESAFSYRRYVKADAQERSQ